MTCVPKAQGTIVKAEIWDPLRNFGTICPNRLDRDLDLDRELVFVSIWT